MSYNSLSGTIIGPDKIVAKADGTFTQITGSFSGSYINASGTAVSFANIGASEGDGGTIGDPPDGTYADGLFTDFAASTAIGDAIDRFNEIFKSLVPPPAPAVSRVNAGQDGTDAYISFGASNDMSSDGTPYISVGTTAGFAAKDKGDLYETETSGTNFRRSIFRYDTNVTGYINFDVTASVLGSNTNYEADAFRDAETGSLELFVNDTTTPIHTLDLATAVGAGAPGAGTSASLNADGSGFTNISVTASATDANSNTFDLFMHRTARYIVHSASQRRGWNYAFVRHSVGASDDRDTNFVEWVNDDNNETVTVTANSITNISLIGSRYISGVQYNTSATADYQFLISNFYKNAYNLASITCSDSTNNATIANDTMPHIGSDDENKTVAFTQSLSTTDTVILNESIGATASLSHIFKGAATGVTNASGFLIFTPTADNPDEDEEHFKNETWRIPSGAYDSQASVQDPLNGTGSWDSQTHMTGSGNHADGLQLYNNKLVSPLNTTNGGNFQTIPNTESGQPNYSTIPEGIRTFYRAFENTGVSVRDVGVTIKGDAEITANTVDLGANKNIRVLVKTPAKTGWLNLAQLYVYDNVSDGQGGRDVPATLDDSVDAGGAYNVATLGTKVVANGEYFIVKIEADDDWTGHISEISVNFGAGAGGITLPAEVQTVDQNMSVSAQGSSAKLSFGTSNAIAGYSNVLATPNINGAVDVNGSWTINTAQANQRLGVYTKNSSITSKINSSTNSARILDGDTGELQLFVNGTKIHSQSLATPSFTGNSLNVSGSGFTGITERLFPAYNSSPYPRDYTKPYRTGSVVVHPDDQRNGWNYLQVIHSGTFGERDTNYIEWINDGDSAATNISITDGTLSSFDNNGSIYYSSGIRHFASTPSASFVVTASNCYRNVRNSVGNDMFFKIGSNTNLTNLTVQSLTASSTSTATRTDADGLATYPDLNLSTGVHNAALNCEAVYNFSPSTSLVGEFVIASQKHTASVDEIRFDEPPATASSPVASFTTSDFASPSKAGFLRYSADSSNTDEDGSEGFGTETYRLQNRNVTYSQQSHVSGGSGFTYAWNSEYSVNDEASYANYSDGLVVFGGKLIAPPMAGITGSFSTLQAPAGNPDYRITQLTQSTRTYVRYIKNTTGSDKTQFNLVVYGSGTLDRLGAGYNNSSFKIEYKYPNSSATVSTGWLDAGRISEAGNQNTDGQGGVEGVDSGYFPLTISTGGTTVGSYINLLGGAWENGKYLLLRVQASASWDGYIDRIEVS